MGNEKGEAVQEKGNLVKLGCIGVGANKQEFG